MVKGYIIKILLVHDSRYVICHDVDLRYFHIFYWKIVCPMTAERKTYARHLSLWKYISVGVFGWGIFIVTVGSRNDALTVLRPVISRVMRQRGDRIN
jgi:hypothetical protein